MSDSQPQIETQENPSIRTPRWFIRIIVGVLICLLLMYIGISFWIETYTDNWDSLELEKIIKCRPFSDMQFGIKLLIIFLRIKEVLILPLVAILLYAFDVLKADKSKLEIAVPLMLLCFSVLCSSCYVSLSIILNEEYKKMVVSNLCSYGY